MTYEVATNEHGLLDGRGPAWGDLAEDWCPDPACDGLGCHLIHLTQNIDTGGTP